MSTLLGCIADDFTGASDLAAILSRSGVPVNLRLGVPSADDDGDVAAFEIVALKCRTAPRDEAVRDALAAWSWLAARGARRAFWKYCSTFDSTPEGNIGPVADALLEALAERAAAPGDPRQTIHCPAFPENGRSVYRSVLFVGDVPLDESPMRDHPLTPMRDANLVRVLAPQVTGAVGAAFWESVRGGPDALRARLAALAGEGVEHVVVDALDADDLLGIVRATEHLPLLCGGSALALHLPALFRVRGHLAGVDAVRPPAPPEGGGVVLAGSCSDMTRRQVARFGERAPLFRLDPVALANGAQLDEALAWLAARAPGETPVLAASAAPDDVAESQRALGRERAGEVVEEALARLAEAAVNGGRRRVVVAGGESSGAVCQALGVTRLRIGREIAPGVPWTHASGVHGGDVALALKSGNFGTEDFFAEAFETLDAPPDPDPPIDD